MNSSSSTWLGTNLKKLLEIFTIPEVQRIASIIFTVKREIELEESLKVEFLYLPREKKNQIGRTN